MFPKITIIKKRMIIFINTSLNLENTFISGTSEDKECFFESWLMQKFLLYIFDRDIYYGFVKLNNHLRFFIVSFIIIIIIFFTYWK